MRGQVTAQVAGASHLSPAAAPVASGIGAIGARIVKGSTHQAETRTVRTCHGHTASCPDLGTQEGRRCSSLLRVLRKRHAEAPFLRRAIHGAQTVCRWREGCAPPCSDLVRGNRRHPEERRAAHHGRFVRDPVHMSLQMAEPKRAGCSEVAMPSTFSLRI